MRALARPSLILLAATQARTHLMQLCTSSDSAAPGVVTFFLGTYHGCIPSAPGQMHIKTPSGIMNTGLFTDNKCNTQSGIRGSSTGQQLTDSIRSTYSLASSAIVNCFTRQSSSSIGGGSGYTLYASKILQPGTSANGASEACFSSSTVYTWYRVSVNNAISGTYEVWTTGTDINLDPGFTTGTPCSMSASSHFTADLSIVAAGVSCSGFTGSIANADVPAACQTTVPSGFLCPVSCPLNSAGQLDCDNGVWKNTYSCVSAVCSQTAQSQFGGMSGVDGDGCGFTTAVGTTCYPVCASPNWATATATVTCESSGTWSGSGQCSPPGSDNPSNAPGNLNVACSGNAGAFTLTWDAPQGGHGGSPVQRYTFAVGQGTVTGLTTQYNSAQPPSGGVTGTATTSNVVIVVSACNVNHCTPTNVAVNCITDPPVVVSGPGNVVVVGNTNVPTKAIYVPPPGCMPFMPCWNNPPTPGVSGDPFTTDKDGNQVQFFLPHHVDTPLLKCGYFELYGRAKNSGISGDKQQWFDRFSFRADGKDVCVVGVKEGRSVEAPSHDKALSTITVALEGQPVANLTEGTYGGMSVRISRNESRPIGKGFAETADVAIATLDGSTFRMQVQSATASKFVSSTLQRLHTHLDIRFVTLDNKQCTGGVLAEIWGAVPMSDATSKMLKPTE